MAFFEISILGLVLCVLTGVVLGMIGGGGAILMVPILHYFMGFSASQSTLLSLPIVGATSFVGGVAYIRSKEVDLKTGFVFAIPSLVAVTLVRFVILPLIPDTLFVFKNFVLTKDSATLLFFAIVMILVAVAMLRNKNRDVIANHSVFKIARSSTAVGLLTGFVGAGGGFLIVPALHLLLGLKLRVAVGTSLFVIFVNCLLGFLVEVAKGTEIPWSILSYIIVASVFGMFVGLSLAKRASQEFLKKGFAFFILVIAAIILVKEFI